MLVRHRVLRGEAGGFLDVAAEVVPRHGAQVAAGRGIVAAAHERLDRGTLETHSVGQDRARETRVAALIGLRKVEIRVGRLPSVRGQGDVIAASRLERIHEVLRGIGSGDGRALPFGKPHREIVPLETLALGPHDGEDDLRGGVVVRLLRRIQPVQVQVHEFLRRGGRFLPLGLVARGVVQRGGGVQERLGLYGKGDAPRDTADFVVEHAHIGVGQVGGGFGALVHDERNHLVEGSLFDFIRFLGREHRQRHRNVAVTAGQFEEEHGAEDPRLVRIVGQVVQPALVVGVILVHGQVHGLHGLQELVGGADAVIQAPLVVHRVQGAPVAVSEALHAGVRVGILGVVGAALAHRTAHIGDILVREVSVDVGEHPLDVAVRLVHVLPGVVGGRFVKVQEIAARCKERRREDIEDLFHISFPGLKVELDACPEDPGGGIVGPQLFRIGKADVVQAEEVRPGQGDRGVAHLHGLLGDGIGNTHVAELDE